MQTEPTETQPAGPCLMVILGAAGDLTKRKLLPALYNLCRQGLVPESFAVVGMARTQLSTDEWRARMRQDILETATEPLDMALWENLERRLYYQPGNFDDEDAFGALAALMEQVDRVHDLAGNVVFYLATAPDYFAPITARLHARGLTDQHGGARFRRVIVEKPFGRDLHTAHALNQDLRGLLTERQIYRIDHYLGKETVQNILALRFANGIFEPIWTHHYVDHVQITVAETLGVEGRGPYYDRAGALRDMIPNHIFQLISLVAMEPPISFDADAVRDEQCKVIRAIPPFEPEAVLTRTVRGQYGPTRRNGQVIPGYRQEPHVAPGSNTETFVAMKLKIDSWRWTGVPFYLRVGKAMPTRVTEVAIVFKRPPLTLFRNTPIDSLTPNELVLSIQPNEGISLKFGAKVPGATMTLGAVDMDFRYSEHFGTRPATGYERLLYDAMMGDQTLYQRADIVEAAWTVVGPVLDVWQALPPRAFPNYERGTWGPADAAQLIEHDKRRWRSVGA